MSNTRYYVFSNIYGNHSLLKSTLNDIDKHLQQSPSDSHQIIILGDVIDYGREPARVLSALLKRQKEQGDITLLLGNHEHMLLSFIENIEEGPLWLTHGGLATLRSYDIHYEDYAEAIDELYTLQSALKKELPAEHLDLLRSLSPYLITNHYIFTHAGTNHSIPIEEQTTHDFTWSDPIEPETPHPHEKCIVQTHKKCDEPYIESHRICLPGSHRSAGKKRCVIIQSGNKPEILSLASDS